MQKGDKILTINGSEIKSAYALTLYAKNSAQFDGKVDQEVFEDNLSELEGYNIGIETEGPIPKGTQVKLLPWEDEPAVKLDDDILKGLAFYKDKQLKLNEKQIKLRNKIKGKEVYIANGKTTLTDLAYAISDNYRPLDIVVEREGKEIPLKTIYPNKKGQIGIMPKSRMITIKTKTLPQILKGGTAYLGQQTLMQIYGFWQMLSGKIPAKEIHGIVAVAKIGGDVITHGGMASGLLLTAIISAWLAILNFLPIPALDGGHFMFMMIETLRGKPVDEKIIEWTSTVFFVLIIILAFLLIGNDIYALITHQL